MPFIKDIVGAIKPFIIGNDIEEYASHYLFLLLISVIIFSENPTAIHN